MKFILLINMTVWFVGAALLWLTNRLTRRNQNPWLRQLPRAIVAALAFTPSLVHLFHVRVLFPAIAALLRLCCL
jgi:hypothetical protein